MTDSSAKRPLLLMILDGWGYRAESENNAIALGKTPCWDRMWEQDPHALIETSGEAVGLPAGQMGNSEVGHMNIGAGRIVYQDFSRIEQAIRDGSFQQNEAIRDAIHASTGAIHIMGLLSPGGVHSHDEHFIETVKLATTLSDKPVVVHAFLDGRDTPPRSARASIENMQSVLDEHDQSQFGTLTGRYYAMDRDNRWDRVERAYRALTEREADFHADTAVQGLEDAYGRDENDEFVQPTLIGEAPPVADGDSIIFVNFRADRAREITMALVLDEFEGFKREKISLADFVTMTEYKAGLPVSVAFPPVSLHNLFGEEISRAGLRQLRIAETEKYAHVTFFFNGGREDPFEHEDRILVPSPRVKTYDLQPEMSAPELTKKLVAAIRSDDFDVIICNVANPDMVGHTGSLEAAMKAVEAVDQCLAAVSSAIDESGGEMLITADHGNVEQMCDPESGQAHTAHTTNKVPFVYHGRAARMAEGGSLRDIAPTMLKLLDMPQPEAMTGHSLLILDDSDSS